MGKRIFQITLYTTFFFTGVLLLISVFASFFNPAVFPFLSVIALFFPLLWVVNVLFLFLFLIKRSRWSVLSLILLLSGVYQVLLVYNISSSNDTEGSSGKINIVSFNTGNADTINPLASRKAAFDNELFLKSDIICLQEFTPANEKGITVLERFNYKINVDFYGNIGGDSSGLSVYSNYEIIDVGWLKQDLEDTYALWCDLNIDEDTIKLINIQLQSIRLEDNELESMTSFKEIVHLPGHLSSIYAKLKRGFLWREEQVTQLTNLIKASEYPVILCGDFNDPPASFAYREISSLLNDAFLEKGKGFGFTYAGGLPFLRIDYFMVDDRLNVSAYHKMQATHSDHYPIEVEVERME